MSTHLPKTEAYAMSDVASRPFVAFSPRNWPEDFEHENGMYSNLCVGCSQSFVGHKRRVTCQACALGVQSTTELQPPSNTGVPVKTGTLELLVFMPMDGETLDHAFALSWRDFPPTAGWGAPYVSHVLFGDSAYEAFPTVPTAPGLWLLRWDWTEQKDSDGFDDCAYAKQCVWTRPTLDELARLNTIDAALAVQL